MTRGSIARLLLAAWLAAPAGAAAAEAVTAAQEPAAEAPEEEEAGGGVNLDLGFATHYVFRGLNLFMEDEQLDPHMLLAPGATWSVGDTGLSLGWWAAFQLNGNVRDNIDAGAGLEQDAFAAYEFGLTDAVSLGIQLYAYMYPFADEAAAGTDGAPVWLEPGAWVTWSGAVDLGLTVTYMAGVQETLADYRYLYLSPSIGRSLELADALSLELAGSFGSKLWSGAGSKLQDNTFDVTVKAALPWYATDAFYVAPGVGVAWTNLAGLGCGGEIVVWGALNVGVDL
jgi:hypothetical protein